MAQEASRFVVGIDLGTTNSAVCYRLPRRIREIFGGVPITCDGCKSTLVFPTFSKGFTRYRDTTTQK